MLLAVELYRALRRSPEVSAPSSIHHTHRRCIFRCGYGPKQATVLKGPSDAPNMVDAIVVGSGAGGQPPAAYRPVRLARASSVLMLEKGGRLPRDGSTLSAPAQVFKERQVQEQGAMVRRPGGQLFVPSEHYNVGGKTKWYGAALLRFSPHEFEADPAHHCLAWPFGHEELAPYYDEAERLLHVNRFDNEPELQRLVDQHRPPGPEGGWRSEPLPLGPQARDPGERRGGQALRRLRFGRGLQSRRRAQPDRRSDRRRPELQAADKKKVVGAPARARPPERIEGVVCLDGSYYRASA